MILQQGQLWNLGQHRLLIDDCTVPANVQRLMYDQWNLVHAIITDPPFGQIRAAWDSGSLAFVATLQSITHSTATCIVFCSLPYGFALHQAMINQGWLWRFDIVQTKNNAGFKTSKHKPLMAHEHLFAYAKTKPTETTFHGYEAGESGEPWKHRWGSWSNQVYHAHHNLHRNGHPEGKRWLRSVINGRKKQEMQTSERTKHPSQKDILVLERLIKLLSNEGETVYDGFLGSGTTLLAAEATGRRCIGCERDPEYAEMVIEHWQKMTGKVATLAGHYHDRP
jgi:DNA modification methylase